jgi:hypothetical protein
VVFLVGPKPPAFENIPSILAYVSQNKKFISKLLTCERDGKNAATGYGMVAGGSWWAPAVERSMCIDTYTITRAPIVSWQLTLVDIYANQKT